MHWFLPPKKSRKIPFSVGQPVLKFEKSKIGNLNRHLIIKQRSFSFGHKNDLIDSIIWIKVTWIVIYLLYLTKLGLYSTMTWNESSIFAILQSIEIIEPMKMTKIIKTWKPLLITINLYSIVTLR